MTIPGVGQLTSLAWSPQSTILPACVARETSPPISALVPRRYQSGGGTSRQHLEICGQAVRTLLYEAANVMLTR